MVQFSYGNYALNLPNPEFGNKDSLEFIRLTRQTTGGDSIIFRDNAWPKVERLSINFKFLNNDLMQKIRYFNKLVLGKNFTYVDFEGVSWSALITNPEAPMSQNGRNTFDVSFELEAVKL